jgi:hypothetical protein
MKANEAPERLYFGESDKGILDIYSNRESENEIEYIRTDAFIEKACAFLKDRIEHDSIDYPMARMSLIDNFKNYMKGE